MIDLHCHYLPEVDDGAATLQQGLGLLQLAVADGIDQAVLTPHVFPGRFENTARNLLAKFLAFRGAAASAGIPIRLYLGGEVRLLPEAITMLDTQDLPMIGSWQGRQVMLMEFPDGQIPVGAINAVRFFMKRGVVPMIAHPERNREVMRDFRRIQPFVTEGCLLQVTAASVCGRFGDSARKVGDQLLDAGWVSIIATDSHNATHRPPALSLARQVLTQRYGAAAVAKIMDDNPAMIIEARATAEIAGA